MQTVNDNLLREVEMDFFFFRVSEFFELSERDGVREREWIKNFTCKIVFEFVIYYLPKFYQIVIFILDYER